MCKQSLTHTHETYSVVLYVQGEGDYQEKLYLMIDQKGRTNWSDDPGNVHEFDDYGIAGAIARLLKTIQPEAAIHIEAHTLHPIVL